MPKRRVLPYSLDPNQPGDEFLFNLLIAPVAIVVNLVASLPGAVRALARRPAPQPRAGDDPHRHRRRSSPTLERHAQPVRRRPSCSSSASSWASLFLFAGFLVSIEVFREIRIPFTVDPAWRGAPRVAGRRAPIGRDRAPTATVDRPAEASGARLSRPTRGQRGPSALPWPGVQPDREPPRRPTATVADAAATRPPLVGFGIVIGAAALFGTLGPLSRFAYDAGMEPLAVRRLARR